LGLNPVHIDCLLDLLIQNDNFRFLVFMLVFLSLFYFIVSFVVDFAIQGFALGDFLSVAIWWQIRTRLAVFMIRALFYRWKVALGLKFLVTIEILLLLIFLDMDLRKIN